LEETVWANGAEIELVARATTDAVRIVRANRMGQYRVASS